MRLKSRRLSHQSLAWLSVHIWVLLSMLLLLLISAECRKQPERAVIVLYRVDERANFIRMLEEEVRTLPGSDRIKIEFLDATEVQGAIVDRSDEIQKAAEFVKIPDLIGVIGHDDSRSSLLAAPIYNANEILQVVPTSTSRKLKNAGYWTLMLAPDDQAEGAFIGDFVAERMSARAVTIFFEDDEYGIGLKDGLKERLDTRKVSIIDQTAFHSSYRQSAEEAMERFSDLVNASLRKGKPDVLIIAARPREAGQIGRLFYERAPEIQFVVGDGVEVGSFFLNQAEQSASRFFVAQFWHPSSPDVKSCEFVKRFRDYTNRTPFPGDAMKYDGAMLLAQAAIAVGADRKAIRRYLSELGSSRPAYRGVTGEITFLPERPVRMIMTRVEGRSTVPVDER